MRLSEDELYIAMIWRQFKDDPARLSQILNLELTQEAKRNTSQSTRLRWQSWLVVALLLPFFIIIWSWTWLSRTWRNYE